MALKFSYKILLLFVLGTYQTLFTQQIALDLKDLSQGADIIITGKVIQQSSNWNDDGTRIYTKATIQVDEYLKGNNAESSVTVKYLGGEVGEIGEKYSHMPTFEDKEEVLVFLKKDAMSTEFKVYNGENGKISIVNDPKTGEKVTTSNLRISSLKSQIKSYIKD